MNYEFDVCLSFAGEDRTYVRRVAEALRSWSIKVFFDEYQAVDIWGRNLQEHLDEVYRKKSRYCVIFISQHYAEKIWTTHERRSAQSRALKQVQEVYILPVRLDDTELPGFVDTTAYVKAADYTPYQLSELIRQKLFGADVIRLQQSLQHAIDLAQKYLEPHGLVEHEAIAEAIREGIEKAAVKVERDILLPYLKDPSPSVRVVGYIAYQTQPFWWIGTVLLAGINKELEYAERTGDTRPLWQALVAFSLFAATDRSEEMVNKNVDLSPILERLEQNNKLDPGGECKTKLRGMMEAYPRLRGRWF